MKTSAGTRFNWLLAVALGVVIGGASAETPDEQF